MTFKRKKVGLAAAWLALVAVLLIGTRFGSGRSRPAPVPDSLTPAVLSAQWPQIVAHAAGPPRGNPQAAFTLIEFGDFQCPQCDEVRPVLAKMLAQSRGKADLLFVHCPFPNTHAWAVSAAKAADIAAAQGKFWPMYDVLYDNQDNLLPGFYGDYAVKAGLDRTKFQAEYYSGRYDAAVAADIQFCDRLGVDHTPTLLVRDNTRRTVQVLTGAQGVKAFANRVPWADAPRR